MRLVIVSCVFPPEPVVSGQISADIAREMARSGQAVEVIVPFPNRPVGKLYPGYSRRLFRHECNSAGYDVTRCFTLLSRESSIPSRFGESVSFGLTSSLAVLMAPRPDVVYANSWPLFATGLLSLVAKLRGMPLVISVQDVYPESLIIQGRIRSGGRFARWLHWVDGMVARNCQGVIVISERIAEIYQHDRGVPTDRLHLIPNWASSMPDGSDDLGRELRAECGISSDAFLIVYGGNIGMAAGVEGVIEAFRFLPHTAPAHLLVAGSGTSLPFCQELARQIPDGRVVFYTPWPADRTAAVYGAADLLVLPTRGKQSLVSMPSKLISYMLAGRPIIAQAVRDSDVARTIEDVGCGWVVEPDHPQVLAAIMQEVIALSPAERARRGLAGREYALKNLVREANLPHVIAVVEKAAHEGRQNKGMN